MQRFVQGLAGAVAAAVLGSAAPAQDRGADRWAGWPVYEPPVVQQLTARETARIPAREAGQGVAVDAEHVYAVVNFAIGKYRRDTGEQVATWRGPRGGLIGHMNSCYVEAGELWCANSNHPQLPFANSIEVFDAETLTHARTHPLGIMDEGSLVWFDKIEEGWLVGLAHYNDETGLPFKNNTHAGVFLYDDNWRRIGGWALPQAVIERMAPQAASGGAVGPDGLLYVFGHHIPEMYVLGRPPMGPTLLHLATIAIDAEGQAFDFDESRPGEICAISRPNREVRCFALPEVDIPDGVGRFVRLRD